MADGVVHAITRYLQAEHHDAPGVGELLIKLATARTPARSSHGSPAHPAALSVVLDEITGADDVALAAIGATLLSAGPVLEWRVDDGRYYAPGAAVSDSYRLGNMHTVLREGPDVAMGLFLLTSDVDYLDHRHRAPEFYLNLTGGSQWRFDFGPWQVMDAGSVVWNETNAVHATRTGSRPWLSLWAWLADIDQPCEVVPHPEA